MVKIIDKKYCEGNKKEILDAIKGGKLFIYPTDTIYGIGCNAKIYDSVMKIRIIKKREERPFSVIAPSIKWITDNCLINKNAEKWIEKLPGPYTFILAIKNNECINPAVNQGNKHLGVRMPAHWFSDIVKKSRIPFVTTSVNFSGEPHMKSLKELDEKISEEIDYIIDDGFLDNNPSKVVDLTGDNEKIIER